MKDRVVPVLLAVGLVVVVVRFLARSGRFSPDALLERMPDDAPPKWMFRNIEAIRENTDRILERVTAAQAPPSDAAG